MKRSAQVALVLMGVTGTTATAAYLMPSRECRTLPSATAAGPPAALPQNAATPAEPCRRGSSGGHYYRSWGSWGWGSNRSTMTTRPSSSVSTALSGNSGGRVGAVSTGTSSRSSTARGGFGSTGHGMSGGS